MSVVDESGSLRIWPALLKGWRVSGVNSHAVHAADLAVAFAHIVDGHGVDMEPTPVSGGDSQADFSLCRPERTKNRQSSNYSEESKRLTHDRLDSPTSREVSGDGGR